MIISLYNSREYTINEIITLTGVSRGTIYNVINNKKSDTKIGEK